ncbi:MAG: amidohydrolase family protein [Hyphomicrobiales bacterium]
MRCDSHVHIVGPADVYPQVPERTYLAGEASVDTLRRLGAARGITHFVVVQPSFYGADNSATLDALDRLGGHGRGVAVIDPVATPRDTVAMFHHRGVRWLRINLYSPIKAPGGDTLEASFTATAEVARAMGWHVQVIAPLPVLLANAALLAQAPVPVVIDHYGLYGSERPGGADGCRLLELVSLPHVWVKLSAPYRHDRGPLNTLPDREWLAALIAAAPDRCVWGSDWPHPPTHDTQKGPSLAAAYRPLSYEILIDEFLAALPSADLADRIFGGNPARLYGF